MERGHPARPPAWKLPASCATEQLRLINTEEQAQQ